MRGEFILLFHMVHYNFLSFYPTDATYANLVKWRLPQKFFLDENVNGRRMTDDGRQRTPTHGDRSPKWLRWTKICYWRTTWPVSTKLWTQYSWVKGIQISNHILEYHLSTLWLSDKPYMTESFIVDYHINPGGNIKNPNPHCTSARHAHHILEYKLVYSWKYMHFKWQTLQINGNVVCRPSFDSSE